jgi:hypothetical protein
MLQIPPTQDDPSLQTILMMMMMMIAALSTDCEDGSSFVLVD